MNNYRLDITMEPLNKYEKAKQDLIKAKVSFEKLNNTLSIPEVSNNILDVSGIIIWFISVISASINPSMAGVYISIKLICALFTITRNKIKNIIIYFRLSLKFLKL